MSRLGLSMADIAGASFARPSVDSWSCTEVKSQKHSHVWTVKGFTQCDCRYLETTVTVKTTGPPQSQEQLLFRIRLHPQGNKESNRDFTFFQVFCSKNDTKYRAKFSVCNARNEEIATTVYSGQQQLHGYFEYIRRDLLVNHLQPSDELHLLLDLNITFDTVTRSSATGRLTQVGSQDSEVMLVAKDLEQLFRGNKMTDFVIVCGDRELHVHKAIIAARSPVFAAMLDHETEEAQNNSVQLDDVDADVLQEMLYYIYSGKAPNIRDMASDLLAVADRFGLPGLKDMADQILRSILTVDSVCRILVLADMHVAMQLKQDAINFIAQHSCQVIETDGWHQMVTKHPDLVTEVVAAISCGGSTDRAGTSTGTTTEPSIKRPRFASAVIFRPS